MFQLVKEKSFYSTLVKIAVPVTLQSMISFAVNMLDTVMVGSLGDVILSATSLGNQVSIYMMNIINGLAMGASMLISQYWGKNDIPRIKTIFGIGMKSSLIISILVTLLIQLIPTTMMGIFTNDSAIIAEGVKYLSIISWSFVIMCISQTLISMLRCVEVVRIGLVVSIVAFFTNVGLNYVLIFGKLGLPAMGISGAAMATLISRIVECVIVLVYIIFIDKKLKLKFKDLWHNDWQLWKDYFKHGLPIASGNILWGLVGVFKAAIIGRLTAAAISANSITEVVLSLVTTISSGLSSASLVIIGKTVGAKEYDKTRHYAKTLQLIFFCFGFIAAIGVLLVRGPIIALYDVTPEAKQLAMEFLVYGAITIWATCYAATCFVGINRGSGDANFVVAVDMICGWLIVLPLMFLALKLGLPAPIVFLFSRIDQILKVFIAFVRLNLTDRWIVNVTRD